MASKFPGFSLNGTSTYISTVLSPLASSMFAPGIQQMAESFKTTESAVIACQTGYVAMLGIGPLILAPLSETFGRKILYLGCFGAFTVLQIPAALSPNVATLITARTITGFFGSMSSLQTKCRNLGDSNDRTGVGIANGGGTISDMYDPSERAGIFGWYLLGPLLGPTIGPLLGGTIMQNLTWPWIFWIMAIICAVNVTMGFLFLEESYVPVLLDHRKREHEKSEGGNYYYEGEDERPLSTKLYHSIQRPIKILFTQPIVLTMASYQALIFATTYSLYTQMPAIYGEDGKGYGFSMQQVGLLYLGPGLGFFISVLFVVPRIDTIFNHLTKSNNGKSKPEFRLPVANVGSLLIPISLFWFAWTVQFKVHWFVTILSTFFYGIGQVAVFNSTQNYYIDAFEKYAASAIAAGALFRSIIGGVIPMFTPALFDKFGVGWGMSVFAFVGVGLAPSPLLFYYFGEGLRERFAIEL
jgi:MFS family permease